MWGTDSQRNRFMLIVSVGVLLIVALLRIAAPYSVASGWIIAAGMMTLLVSALATLITGQTRPQPRAIITAFLIVLTLAVFAHSLFS